MSDVIDVLVNGMNVGLGESETKRKGRHGVVLARMRPTSRNVIALLMKKRRQGSGFGDGQAKKAE
jgi:hypothetical protein